LAATTTRPETVEVVLVVDADDPASAAVQHPGVEIKHAIVPAGLTMGELNTMGYQAATGAYLMLLNDDVVVRTPGWDEQVRTALLPFADKIVLVHANDLLFRETFCTFPLVSRTYCQLAGGICPAEYARYRIDDHIFDVFNLLEQLGERRRVYLPEVVFEHLNYTEGEGGDRTYRLNQNYVRIDSPPFDALGPQRLALAMRLFKYIDRMRGWSGLAQRVAAGLRRAHVCWRGKGFRGLVRAGWRHLARRAM
jgi:hypothetical protein